MIRSAITVCLVEQARKGPFVFHGDLAAGCRAASEAGFDAIELFAPSASVIRTLPLPRVLTEFGLRLAAVGTGAGMVVHRLSLTDPDASRREAATSFIRDLVEVGAEFGAPAIIGSMQGRWDDVVPRELATAWLRDALQQLGELAGRRGATLLYEPLNRYETNMANTLAQGVDLLRPLAHIPVRLLADLFHMNIEEADLAAALIQAGPAVGHLHFADSNRQAVGFGHTPMAPVAEALARIGYDGYASAEVFPVPDETTCARQTIESFRRFFRS
jgi:sugar phosphate isomerase/epimerase